MGGVASVARNIRVATGSYVRERAKIKGHVQEMRRRHKNPVLVARELNFLYNLIMNYAQPERTVIWKLFHKVPTAEAIARAIKKYMHKLSVTRPAVAVLSQVCRDVDVLADIRSAGGLRLVQDIHAMYHESEPDMMKDLRHVFAALRGAYRPAKALGLAMSKEDPELALLVMEFNEDDAAVQGQALEVLAQLAKVERTQPRLRAVATTLPRILKTLRKHMKHSDIVLFATLTLTALAKHKGMAREIGREGGVEALLEVLKPKWSQVVEVDALQQTLWALDQLVASYEPNAWRIQECGGKPVLTEIAQRLPLSSVTQRADRINMQIEKASRTLSFLEHLQATAKATDKEFPFGRQLKDTRARLKHLRKQQAGGTLSALQVLFVPDRLRTLHWDRNPMAATQEADAELAQGSAVQAALARRRSVRRGDAMVDENLAGARALTTHLHDGLAAEASGDGTGARAATRMPPSHISLKERLQHTGARVGTLAVAASAFATNGRERRESLDASARIAARLRRRSSASSSASAGTRSTATTTAAAAAAAAAATITPRGAGTVAASPPRPRRTAAADTARDRAALLSVHGGSPTKAQRPKSKKSSLSRVSAALARHAVQHHAQQSSPPTRALPPVRLKGRTAPKQAAQNVAPVSATAVAAGETAGQTGMGMVGPTSVGSAGGTGFTSVGSAGGTGFMMDKAARAQAEAASAREYQVQQKALTAKGTLYGWDADERRHRLAAEQRAAAIRSVKRVEAEQARLREARRVRRLKAEKAARVREAAAGSREGVAPQPGSTSVTQQSRRHKHNVQVVIEAGDDRPSALSSRRLQFDKHHKHLVEAALQEAHAAAAAGEGAGALAGVGGEEGAGEEPDLLLHTARSTVTQSTARRRSSAAVSAATAISALPTTASASLDGGSVASSSAAGGVDFADHLRLLFSAHTSSAKPIQPASVRKRLAGSSGRRLSTQSEGTPSARAPPSHSQSGGGHRSSSGGGGGGDIVYGAYGSGGGSGGGSGSGSGGDMARLNGHPSGAHHGATSSRARQRPQSAAATRRRALPQAPRRHAKPPASTHTSVSASASAHGGRAANIGSRGGTPTSSRTSLSHSHSMRVPSSSSSSSSSPASATSTGLRPASARRTRVPGSRPGAMPEDLARLGGVDAVIKATEAKLRRRAARRSRDGMTLDERVEQMQAYSRQLDASLQLEHEREQRSAWGESGGGGEPSSAHVEAIKVTKRRRGNAYHY